MYSPQHQFKRAIERAQAICDQAEARERDLTDGEYAEVKRLVGEAKKANSEAALADELDSIITGKGHGMSTKTRTLSALVRHAAGAKDLTATPHLVVSTDFIGTPGVLEGIMPARIWNAFPQRRGSGGSVRYLRQTGTPGGAAVVAPGAVKPTAEWGLSQQDDPFNVLAVISPNVANSVIADGGSDFDSFLNNTLSAAVYQALDAYAVSELTAEGGKTQAFATDAITSIRKAVTQLEEDGFEASHLFVSPADNEALSLDTDAEDRYRFGGPTEGNVDRVSITGALEVTLENTESGETLTLNIPGTGSTSTMRSPTEDVTSSSRSRVTSISYPDASS
jgi:hypothetical protein